MKTIIEPVDVAYLVKNWLREQMMSEFSELSVALALGAWKTGDNPRMVVFDDSGPNALWPVATDPTIRITTWTTGRGRRYAHRAMALLLGKTIPGIAAVLPGLGISETTDAKNDGNVVSFTVRTRVRTVR